VAECRAGPKRRLEHRAAALAAATAELAMNINTLSIVATERTRENTLFNFRSLQPPPRCDDLPIGESSQRTDRQRGSQAGRNRRLENLCEIAQRAHAEVRPQRAARPLRARTVSAARQDQ